MATGYKTPQDVKQDARIRLYFHIHEQNPINVYTLNSRPIAGTDVLYIYIYIIIDPQYLWVCVNASSIFIYFFQDMPIMYFVLTFCPIISSNDI
jgi:hypothetical protein